jgi:hypothetical protein
MKLLVYVQFISNVKDLFCLSLLWKGRWYYQNCKFSVDTDSNGYSSSCLIWKWRKLKKEKTKKLGNVGKVPVETQNGDPHKENTRQSTHALELSGVPAEIKPPPSTKTASFSVS